MAITNNIKIIKESNVSDSRNSGYVCSCSALAQVYYNYDVNKYYLRLKTSAVGSTNYNYALRYGYNMFANNNSILSVQYPQTEVSKNGAFTTTFSDVTYDLTSVQDMMTGKYITPSNISGSANIMYLNVANPQTGNPISASASVQNVSLTADKTAPTITIAATPSHTSASIKWTSDIALKSLTGKIGSYTFYTGTFSAGTKSGTFTISKLKPQTTYSVTCTGVRWNHTVSGSKSVNMTTTALPTISTTPSLNIGSNITMSMSKTFPLATTLRMIFTNTTNSNTYTKDTTLNANTSSVTIDLASVAPNLYSLSSNVKTLSVSAHIRSSGTDYNNTAYTVTSTSKTGTATVVNSNPTFSNFTYGQSDTTISGVLGSTTHAPNGCGNLNMQISTSNKGVAKNSATMARYDYEIRDFGYNGADAGDGLLIRNGTLPYYADATVSADIGTLKVSMTVPHTLRVSIRAVDSRGFTSGWVSKNYVLIPYEKPTGTFNVHRVNNFEQEIVWDFESYCYLLPMGGTNKNTSYTAKVRVYDIAANTWTEYTNISNLVTASTTTYYKKVTNLITDINRIYDLPREKYYKIEFTLSDSLYSTVYTFDISAGISILGIHDDGHVTVGVQPDFNDDCLLQIGSDASLNVDIDSLKAKIDALF